MENQKLKELGRKIVVLRAEKNMTQTELYKLAGLSYTTISFIENGKKVPRVSTLYRIAKVLDVNPYELTKYLD